MASTNFKITRHTKIIKCFQSQEKNHSKQADPEMIDMMELAARNLKRYNNYIQGFKGKYEYKREN